MLPFSFSTHAACSLNSRHGSKQSSCADAECPPPTQIGQPPRGLALPRQTNEGKKEGHGRWRSLKPALFGTWGSFQAGLCSAKAGTHPTTRYPWQLAVVRMPLLPVLWRNRTVAEVSTESLNNVASGTGILQCVAHVTRQPRQI